MCIGHVYAQCGIEIMEFKLRILQRKPIFTQNLDEPTMPQSPELTFCIISLNNSRYLPFCLRLLEKYLSIHGKQK